MVFKVGVIIYKLRNCGVIFKNYCQKFNVIFLAKGCNYIQSSSFIGRLRPFNILLNLSHQKYIPRSL